MLFSTLHDSKNDDTGGNKYGDFLSHLAGVMELRCLQPLDVLWFVEATMQLGSKRSMAVFAFDEVRSGLCRETSAA